MLCTILLLCLLWEASENSKNARDVQEWRRANAAYTKQLQKAKRENFTKFVEQLNYRTDSAKVHRHINTLSDKWEDKPTDPIKSTNKSLHSDYKIANKFNTYYKEEHKLSQINKKLDKTIKKQLRKTSEQKHDIFTREYTMVELNVAIEKLKTKKSPGPDKIHAEFIKNLGQRGKILLLNIFNNV